MKTSLAAGALAFLLVVSAWAIPQTIQSPNVFVRSAGVSFEDFASDPAAWDGKADLKGNWVAHGDTLKLTDSAAVFGFPADEITAQRQSGQVQGFRVVLHATEKKAGVKAGDSAGSVAANVRAFTGDSGASQGGGVTVFHYKGVIIIVTPGSGHQVVVEFKHG